MEKTTTTLSHQFHAHKKEEPQSADSEHSSHGSEHHRSNSRAKEAYTPGLTYTPSHPPPPVHAHHPTTPVVPHHRQMNPTASHHQKFPIQSLPMSAHGDGAYVQPIASHPTPHAHGGSYSHQMASSSSSVPGPQTQSMFSPSPTGHPQSNIPLPPGEHPQPMISPPRGGDPWSITSPPTSAHGPPGTYHVPSHPIPKRYHPVPVPHNDEASRRRKKSPEPKKERKRNAKDGGLDDHAELGLEFIGKVIKEIA